MRDADVSFSYFNLREVRHALVGRCIPSLQLFANAELSCTGMNSNNVWVGALFLDRGEAVQGTRVMCTNAPADNSTTMFVFQNR